MRIFSLMFLVSIVAAIGSSPLFAQCAGCGANHNRTERARIQENQRLERVDPPIRPDPVGNALIGGAVTGTMRGAAAGAASAARSGAIGGTVQEIRRGQTDNQRTGRGGSSDPRYNPGTLFNR